MLYRRITLTVFEFKNRNPPLLHLVLHSRIETFGSDVGSRVCSTSLTYLIWWSGHHIFLFLLFFFPICDSFIRCLLMYALFSVRLQLKLSLLMENVECGDGEVWNATWICESLLIDFAVGFKIHTLFGTWLNGSAGVVIIIVYRYRWIW